MSSHRGKSLFANVSANLVVGAAALGYAVIVPAVVLRRFGADVYGNWYLAFQIAAYIVILDLGSQFLVTSEAATLVPGSRPARFTTAAMTLQSGLGVAVVCAAAAWAELSGQARLAQLTAVLGIAAIASLLASTVRAWFGGLRQAHVPAAWLVCARVGSLVGLAVAAGIGAGVVPLTIAVAAPQLAIHAGLLLWARRRPSPWARPDREAFRRVVRGTAPLALWTICGIFISGVDIFVVRAVDPSSVSRYAVALPLLAIPTGAVTALITAWTPRVAETQQASGGGGAAITKTGTTLMAAALSLGALVFVGFADVLVDLLAGPGQWATAATYLRVLYISTSLRFVFLPWAIFLIVRGEQGAIALAPVAEAAINLVASVVLGLWLGALGVALGTLAGAGAASVLYLTWGVRRAPLSGISAQTLLGAIARARVPILAATAVGATVLTHVPTTWRWFAVLGALAVDSWWLRSYRSSAKAPGEHQQRLVDAARLDP